MLARYDFHFDNPAWQMQYIIGFLVIYKQRINVVYKQCIHVVQSNAF